VDGDLLIADSMHIGKKCGDSNVDPIAIPFIYVG
jgi:hypothetical protein